MALSLFLFSSTIFAYADDAKGASTNTARAVSSGSDTQVITDNIDVPTINSRFDNGDNLIEWDSNVVHGGAENGKTGSAA